MAYTIAKVTNAHIMSIGDGTRTDYHGYGTIEKIYAKGDDVIIVMDVAGKETVFRHPYTDITSPAGANAQAKVDAIAALLVQ